MNTFRSFVLFWSFKCSLCRIENFLNNLYLPMSVEWPLAKLVCSLVTSATKVSNLFSIKADVLIFLCIRSSAVAKAAHRYACKLEFCILIRANCIIKIRYSTTTTIKIYRPLTPFSVWPFLNQCLNPCQLFSKLIYPKPTNLFLLSFRCITLYNFGRIRLLAFFLVNKPCYTDQ